VRGGGTLVVSYFSGVVDEEDAVYLGGYPGALRDILGVCVDEFLPLRSDWTVALAGPALDGTGTGTGTGSGTGTGTVWAEAVELLGAESVLSYVDGPAAGGPAVTRHRFGAGTAWYVSTRPDPGTLREILRRAAADAGVEFDTETPDTLELVRREAADGTRYLFAINHGDAAVAIPEQQEAAGENQPGRVDLLTGESLAGPAEVPPGGVRVLRTGRAAR